MMKYTILLMTLLFSYTIYAQDEIPNEEQDTFNIYEGLYDFIQDSLIDEIAELPNYDVLDKSEYLIPSAPAFSLLGVTPEIVNRPGVVRDFKVDWRIKNYQIAPDFALEAQPMWLFHFNKKGLSYYAQSSKFMQALSTLSVSLGTAKLDGVNHFSYAAKMTIYRENDPLKDQALLKDLYFAESKARLEVDAKIKALEIELLNAKTKEDKKRIAELIDYRKLQKRNVINTTRDQMQALTDEHIGQYWNASSLDLSYGRVFTFNNNAGDDIYINKAGHAFWLNGALRSGKNGLLSAMIKMKKVGGLSESLLGVNYRYGGSRFSFYAEVVNERKFERAADFIDIEDPFSDKFSKDLGISWLTPDEDVVKENVLTIAYGGDFKLSRGILLNFALRTQFQKDLSFNKLIPVANLTCLMR